MIFKDPILLCLLGKNDNKPWRNWSRIFASNVQASFHFWNLKTMKIYARLVLKILYFLSKGINFIFFVKIMSMNSLFGLTKGASGHKQWCIRLIDLPISEIYPKYCNVRFDFCPLCPAPLLGTFPKVYHVRVLKASRVSLFVCWVQAGSGFV